MGDVSSSKFSSAEINFSIFKLGIGLSQSLIETSSPLAATGCAMGLLSGVMLNVSGVKLAGEGDSPAVDCLVTTESSGGN